jgi:superfamily II DNA/RNA helicase
MEKKLNFSDLGISDVLLKSIEKKGYKTPSAIQS